MGPTVLYALAAPSTPEEVREEIEKITIAEVERLKRQAGIHRCDVYFPQLAEIQPRQ